MKFPFKSIGLATLLATFVQCASVQNSEEYIELPLSGKQNFGSYHVYDDSQYFLFTETEKRFDNRTATTILRDLNNSDKELLRIEGVYRHSAFVGGRLFLVVEKYNSKQNPDSSQYEFYNINVDDFKVETKHAWAIENSFIHGLAFDSESIGCIFYRSSGDPYDSKVLFTKTGGEEWDEIELNRPVLKVQKNQNSLWINSYYRRNDQNIIYKFGTETGIEDSISLECYIADILVNNDIEVEFISKSESLTYFYAKNQEAKFNKIVVTDDDDFKPVKLVGYGENRFIFGLNSRSHNNGGLAASEKILLFSQNSGETWDAKQLDIRCQFNTISVFENILTMYLGNGVLQKLDLSVRP